MADGEPAPTPALPDPDRAQRDVNADGGGSTVPATNRTAPLPHGDRRGRTESATNPTEPLPQRAAIAPSAISQRRGAGEGETVPARPPGDSMVELIISWLLRIGVWASIAIIVAGFALLIAQD